MDEMVTVQLNLIQWRMEGMVGAIKGVLERMFARIRLDVIIVKHGFILHGCRTEYLHSV